MNGIGRGLHTGWIITMIGVLLAASASGGVRYVWPNSPGPELPYDTWATAAHAIQVAIDAAEAGDTVLVTNGVYATGGRAVYSIMTNRVIINKAIRVESVNGPAVTVIDGAPAPGGGNGDGAIRCVYVGTNAVLSGFTLTNGQRIGRKSGQEDAKRFASFCSGTGPNHSSSRASLTADFSDCTGGKEIRAGRALSVASGKSVVHPVLAAASPRWNLSPIRGNKFSEVLR